MSYSPNFRGSTSSAPSESVQSVLDNNTGGTIDALTPIYSNTSGDMALIDVSDESKSFAIAGITVGSVAHLSSGSIANSGRLTDVTVTGVFGDTLYVSKAGGLTSTKPSEGVGGFLAGDWIIRIGVVVKNQNNPSNKDLLLQISVVGQL